MNTKIRILATAAANFNVELQHVLHWSAEQDHAIEERVTGILADVQSRGDSAVLEYTKRFDGVDASTPLECMRGAASIRGEDYLAKIARASVVA